VKKYQEKKAMFKRFLKHVDPTMPVENLKPAAAISYVMAQKEARSGYAANKDRKNLVAGWNWGMKYMDPPLPGPNPCLVERMPEIRQPRYVPPEEDFWKVYEAAEGQDKVMLLAFLHLAARRGEVFRITWADVDFGNSRIRLWTRKRHGGQALCWRNINRPKYIQICCKQKYMQFGNSDQADMSGTSRHCMHP